MTRVGWGNICGELWPASQISASKQRTGYPASTAGGYPVGPRGPDICVGVLARYPTQKTARYPTQKRDQISVNCTQADIRQLHTARYPSAAHSRISGNGMGTDIWPCERTRFLPTPTRYLAHVGTTQSQGDPRYLTHGRQISGMCAQEG